jgi:hypothetical protein
VTLFIPGRESMRNYQITLEKYLKLADIVTWKFFQAAL